MTDFLTSFNYTMDSEDHSRSGIVTPEPLGCTSKGTVTVTGAATSMACLMSGVGGNPAQVQPQCSVTAASTVTVQFCTVVAVTPAAQTYAIRVF